MWVARNGHYAVAKLLLEQGAGVGLADKDSRTALCKAQAFNYQDVVELLQQYKLKAGGNAEEEG